MYCKVIADLVGVLGSVARLGQSQDIPNGIRYAQTLSWHLPPQNLPVHFKQWGQLGGMEAVGAGGGSRLPSGFWR